MSFTPNIFILGSTVFGDEKPRDVAYYAASQRLNVDELLFNYSISGDRVFYIASATDEFGANSPRQSSPLFSLLEGHPNHKGDGIYLFEDEVGFIVVIKKESSFSSLRGVDSECLEFITENESGQSLFIFSKNADTELFKESYLYTQIINSSFEEERISIEAISDIDNQGSSWEFLQYEELQKSHSTEKKASLLLALSGVVMIAFAVGIYGAGVVKQNNTFPQQVFSFTEKVKSVSDSARSSDKFARFVKFETELKANVYELGGWVDYIEIMPYESDKKGKSKGAPKGFQDALTVSWGVHLSSWATQEQIAKLSLSKVLKEGGMLSGQGKEVWK